MTYEQLPKEIQTLLSDEHHHLDNGTIIYTEEVVLKALSMLDGMWRKYQEHIKEVVESNKYQKRLTESEMKYIWDNKN